MQLNDHEKAVLDFEAQQWTYRGAEEQAIRATFDWSATRYSTDPRPLAYAPMLVRRLLRLRRGRAAQRSARRRASGT